MNKVISQMRMDWAATQPQDLQPGIYSFSLDKPITIEIVSQQIRVMDYQVCF